MRVDDGEWRFLFPEMKQRRNQRHVFVHVGEISRVICMAVIHARLSRRGRDTSSPPQLGQRPFISSPQRAQKVHS
jgi:hypothetical protein